MKKDNLFKIARSIFLQDNVSRQLYAAMYNLGDFINEDLGSYSGQPKNLYKLFQVFIGSYPQSNLQFIEKNANTFRVYPFLADGQVDFNSTPKQINGIESLYSYLHTNNSVGSYSPNSVLPLLQRLRTTLGYYANTENKYKKFIDINDIASEYQDVNSSYTDILARIVNLVANKWIQDITTQIGNVLHKQDLGIIPLIFEQSKTTSPSSILRNLQQQIVNTIIKQLDSNKIVYKQDDKNFNTIWNNVSVNMKRIAQYVLQLSLVSKLIDSPVLDNQKGDTQKGSLKKIQGLIGKATQYIGSIVKFIYDVENSQQLSDEQKKLILDVINSSNNNQQLARSWQDAIVNMQDITPQLPNPQFENYNSGNPQNALKSAKTTFLHFLTGNNGNLAVGNWDKIRSNLNYVFRNNIQYKQYIDEFDRIIQFLSDSYYRSVVGKMAMAQRNQTQPIIDDIQSKMQSLKQHKDYVSYRDVIELFLNKLRERTATAQDVQDMTKIGFGYFARIIKNKQKTIVGVVNCFGWEKKFDELASKYNLDKNTANGIKSYINVRNSKQINRHQLDGVQFAVSSLLKCFLIDD